MNQSDLGRTSMEDVTEILLQLEDGLALIACATDAAEWLQLSLEDFARTSVDRFVERAGDEEWTTLTSRMNASDAPLASAVAGILRRAVDDVNEVVG